MDNKVALIGVYPPPIGGISIHIKRLSDYLDQNGVSYTIYDNTAGNKDKDVVYTASIEKWSMKYFFTAKEKIIHCHFLRWQVRFFLALLKLRGKRVIFTFHSFRPEDSVGLFKRVLIKLTARLGDVFICVTNEIANDLVALGIPQRKIQVIPAFIAPIEIGQLPPTVEQLIEGATPLIVANGSIGVKYQGEELYGADLCIEMVRRLVPDFPHLKLIYCITFTTDSSYRADLEQRVIDFGLEENMVFIEAIDFNPLVKRADLMLRPTNSDGDAVSIRESLYFGTAVLASDCTERPDGVVTFRNRDVDDMVRKAREALNKGRALPQRGIDFAEDVVNTYALN